MARAAVYRVLVDGRDISSVLSPLLSSMRISDKAGTTSDSCDIDLDDSGGQIAFPKVGAEMRVMLGWSDASITEVFVGKVDDVRSSGSRGGGRTMKISAKGLDTKGKAKQRQQKHVDKAKLPDALKKIGEGAGVTDITVDPDLAKIEREYWAADNESFIGFGERIAKEVGGTFRIRNGKAVMAKKGSGKSPTGKTLPTILATWGDNLLSWDVTPVMGRPRQKKVRARYYDKKAAKWEETEAEVQDDEAEATLTRKGAVADKGESGDANNSDKADTESDKGGGSVVVDGTTSAHPEGTCILAGTRPGIDGTYRIEGVDHSVARGGGWTTTLDLKKPSGDAGKDNRKAKK